MLQESKDMSNCWWDGPGDCDFRGTRVSQWGQRLGMGLEDILSVKKCRSTFPTKGQAQKKPRDEKACECYGLHE